MDSSLASDRREAEASAASDPSAPLTYRLATASDCEQLSILVNSAYRGESSRQGWTTEDALVGGQRTDSDKLKEVVANENSAILIFFDRETQILIGSVLLQDITGGKAVQGGCCVPVSDGSTANKVLIGMLTVRPDLQARGYGKFILSVGEKYARDRCHAQVLEMTVFDVRTELIAYYNRRGYVDTGRRQLFPYNDPRTGIAKRNDLTFSILSKTL